MLKEQSTTMTYSKYGIYDVDNKIDLKIPFSNLKIERVSEKQFRYTRENSDETIKSNLINMDTGSLQIEIAPILPLHLPAKRTKHLLLNFPDHVYVEGKTNASVYIEFPVEIGLFVINQRKDKRLLDCLTCDPENSRFALYGTPDEGTFCKYADVAAGIKSEVKPQPYINGIIKLTIRNQTPKELSIKKILFAATNHDLYYSDSESHVDDLVFTIKQDPGKNSFAESTSESLKGQGDWRTSPRTETKTSEICLMSEGFE